MGLTRTFGTPTIPQTINGLVLHLKADAGVFSDAGTTPCTDAQSVYQWNDQSGLNNHAVQSGAAGLRPVYKTNIINTSLPVMRFTAASTQGMILNSAIRSPDMTVFFVGKKTGTTKVITALGDSVQSNLVNFSDGSSYWRNKENTNNIVLVTGHWTAWSLVTELKNQTAGTAIVNGVSYTGNWNATSSLKYTLVGYSSVRNYFTDGDIAEIIIYNRALNAAEITTVTAYLNTKYAVY